MHTVK